MAENSLISEEFRNKVGVEWEVGVYDVEKGMIRKFVRATGDPNPLWQDEEYARQSQYGSTIAPPNFILTIGGEQFGQLIASMFPEGLLHGSTELECYQPVRPGDRIAVTVKIASIRELRSSKTVFVIFALTYTNQKHELVARCRQTMVGYSTREVANG